MKTIRLFSLTKNISLGILITMMMFSFTSCTKKVIFLTSSVVPAAKGYAFVKRDNNNNYDIKIRISNLAEVTRLQPSKQPYVVWMITDQRKTENIGKLNSSKSALSKQMKASFETVSSSKPTKIFISAENDGSTQYPGEQVILTTDIF
jgi:hypothetical protein